MKLLQETIEFIRKICNDVPFKIWAINKYNNEIINIYGNGLLDVDKLDIGMDMIECIEKNGNKYYVFNFPEDIKLVLVIDDEKVRLNQEDLDKLYKSFFSTYENELINIKKREVKILIDSIIGMSRASEKYSLLENIIESAIKVIGKADSGYIQMIDKKNNILRVEGAYGFNDRIYDCLVTPGEYITGKVYENGEGKIYNSRESVMEMIDIEMKKDKNFKNNRYIERFIRIRGFHGLISVPVQYKDTKLGVITLVQSSKYFPFSKSDEVFLESFASQVAVTLMNYELYENLKDKLKYVEKLNKELSIKNKTIDFKNKIYRELSKMSLKEEPLSKMVEVFAKTLDLELIFFNRIEDIVEYEGLNIGESKDLRSIIDSYIENNEESLEYHNLYFHVIKNGEIVLGYIIMKDDIRKNINCYFIFKEGLTVITLEIMKKYCLIDALYKKTHEYFTRLLKSSDEREMIYYAEYLNIPLQEKYSLMTIEIRNYNDIQTLEFDLHKLVSIVREQLINYNILIYGFHNKVNVLFYSLENSEIDKVVGLMEAILEEWLNKENTDIIAGIGGSYEGLKGISISNYEKEKALRYVSTKTDKYIIKYDSIGIDSLFVNQGAEDISRFIQETLGPLRTKKCKKSNLEETLFMYINSNKSASKAADKLFIHINTLYKRIEKIEELLKIDFDNPEDNLKIQLAYHLSSANLNNLK